MSKHLIICLHGMGSYGDKWGADNVGGPLKKAYESYPTLIDEDGFEDRFSFRYINYDQFFEEHLKRIRDKQIELSNLAPRAEAIINGFGEAVKKIVTLYNAVDVSEDNFWATHFGDVFLYLIDDHIRGQVNSYVQAEIVKSLQEFIDETNGHGVCSIIAHSLGTAVATEALQQLYTDDTSILHKFGKLKTLMMVANVTNLCSAVSRADVYNNAVYPHASRFSGVCYHYINAWHDLDPFTLVRRFRPDKDLWNRTGGDSDLDGHIYIEKSLAARSIQQKNVHALTHYLSHPEIHLALFQYLQSDPTKSAVADKVRNTAVEAWEEETLWNKLLGELNKTKKNTDENLKDAQEKIKNLMVSRDLDDLFEAVKEAQDAISKLDDTKNNIKQIKGNLLNIIKDFLGS